MMICPRSLLASVPSGENRTYNRYVVIGSLRAGTFLLCSTLRKHDQVRSYGELFNPSCVPLAAAGLGRITSPSLLQFRRSRPVEFLEKICNPPVPENIKAIGFKVFYGHLDGLVKVTDYFIKSKNLKIVHLKRRNILRQFVSLKLALETGVWGIPSVDQRKRVSVFISVDEFIHAADSILDRQHLYERKFSDHQYMELCYEDLEPNQEEGFNDLQSFIGVDVQTLKPDLVKQNILPLREVIRNFDEVVSRLKNTPYSVFVD